jgi:hypothetical protein
VARRFPPGMVNSCLTSRAMPTGWRHQSAGLHSSSYDTVTHCSNVLRLLDHLVGDCEHT